MRDIVPLGDVDAELQRIGALRFELAGGRGVIGAAASMSWKPIDRTFEVLAYRQRNRWGSEREVNLDDVRAIDERHPSTFNNYDGERCKAAITPRSPCPILFGVRGDDPGELIKALPEIRSEPKDRWLLFETNQGTDDHIIRRWKALLPNRSYELAGMVSSIPKTLQGGHVVFRLQIKEDKELDCAAYEPSLSFRDVVRALLPGDKVRAMGELRDNPRTLNLEKLEIMSLAKVERKRSNPICRVCGKSMQSRGRGGGYRCKRCGGKAPEEAAERSTEARTVELGWYEPPTCSRRHLSKPLKRMAI
ncbi:MAG TPA: tRNA(Ile)(2)-agmatinylcytidine synthase [Methanomassiliicoccales archaeon]|nr:tRNA(Ile)(2)-agmatinylcytidine synthase [Methanomassiliicoccales archaeon]